VQGVGGRQVYFATQDVAQLSSQLNELEQTNMSIGFVFYKDVDIAAFFTLSTGYRSKNRKSFNRKSAQDIPVISQYRQDVFSFHVENI
jgi:hypothetical protein